MLKSYFQDLGALEKCWVSPVSSKGRERTFPAYIKMYRDYIVLIFREKEYAHTFWMGICSQKPTMLKIYACSNICSDSIIYNI